MTTLELYRKHKKGEIGRDRFLYEVRRDNNLPWITNITSYDDAVKILKNKGIIKEAQFEPQNIPTDPLVDRVNPYALKREVEKLLAKETELTNDSYKLALNKAAKKLTTPEAVKQAMFANADSVAKADAKLQTQPVKKNNLKDKANEMKKAKGQAMPKATAAPTKENKKTKKPKGVEVMKDKGVEGSEKVLRETALAELQSFLKKKLNLSEDVHYEYHVGSEVYLPEGGMGKIIEITGGTCTVEVADGTHRDIQMNVLGHAKKKAMEAAAQPAHTQEAKPAEINEEETNVIEEASSVDSIIRALEEAQEQLRDGVESLKSAKRQMLSSGDHELSRIGERIYRYMLGHIEPVIDNDHYWMSKNESIQDIIDNLRGDEGEDEEDLDEDSAQTAALRKKANDAEKQYLQARIRDIQTGDKINP